MRVYNLNNYKAKYSLSVALGSFDGLHHGHVKVIKSAVEEAKKDKNLKSAVLSVNRPFLGEERSQLRILTDSLKINELSKMGVDILINIDLREVRDMTAESFFKNVMVTRLKVSAAYCGYNCRFGKNASGDAQMLKQLCEESGLKCGITEPVVIGEQTVSSTRIRMAIEAGYVDTATVLLGRPFTFDFTVSGGDHIGRKIGTPTINQQFGQEFVKPKFGVYAARAEVCGVIYPAVCNIGIRPTVGGTKPRAETYIIGFSGDLYGKNIPVSLIKYLRPEIKFPSIERLKEAIANDAHISGEIFNKNK